MNPTGDSHDHEIVQMCAAEVIIVEGRIDPPGGPRATDVREEVAQMHHR